jgi:hypothetical protein
MISTLKRIWEIITFPFILIYTFLLFPFKTAYIILADKKGNKRKINSSVKFDIKQVGQLIYPGLSKDFDDFINLYSKSKTEFRKKYKEIGIDNSELSKLELLQSFGDIKQKLGFIDWKGEEDEFEIEGYIEKQIQKEIVWTNSTLLRKSIPIDKQRDGKFIVKLFQAIDKDLQFINFRLIFLNMGWDAYIFLPVTQQAFNKVFELAPNQFENANEL